MKYNNDFICISREEACCIVGGDDGAASLFRTFGRAMGMLAKLIWYWTHEKEDQDLPYYGVF